mmetsp:Transcript_6598/g.19471  ORF Transcript_6598/g.19471 Transcript_6598/m.19471 type:complete len:149 (+) Transcript_6598:245-691(+)
MRRRHRGLASVLAVAAFRTAAAREPCHSSEAQDYGETCWEINRCQLLHRPSRSDEHVCEGDNGETVCCAKKQSHCCVLDEEQVLILLIVTTFALVIALTVLCWKCRPRPSEEPSDGHVGRGSTMAVEMVPQNHQPTNVVYRSTPRAVL